MGFKLPGKSIQTGTSAHSSALKMVTEQRAASALKQKLSDIDGVLNKKPKTEKVTEKITKDKTEEVKSSTSKNSKIGKKGLYASDMSWQEGMDKSKEMGGNLNDWTKERKKHKKGTNEYNKIQNKINESLGNKKRYPVTEDKPVESDKVTELKDKQVVTDKKIVDEGETKMGKEGPQQTNEKGEKVYGAADKVTKDLNKSEQKTSNKIAKLTVKETRKKYGRGSAEVKAAKGERKVTKAKNKAMVKTDKKDRKFVAKDEKYDRKITRRKAKGKSTARLEGKKVTNLQKEKEFGESLG